MSDAGKLLPTITNASKVGHPPHFAPPALELPSGRMLSQTAVILNHIAPKLGLAGALGSTVEERSTVSQLVCTALDVNNEAHDVHHPIAVSKYYDDQKAAARERAADFRANRIPKFLTHFENVLTSNPATKEGEQTYLVGKQTTTADLVLFHVLDGLLFAFPERMGVLEESGKHKHVFALHQRVQGEKGIKEYIASGRRQPFSDGLFRYYKELDAKE
ncbi:hypothetical protein IEO21_05700 [Rhodonia placenta]|uniref:GST C-terminal domain-containing protein n=1 Tax=Rhodonia placenta TaxID=104341 RepID=A0A8H7P1I0_9APHY|nr:hypothetical protein IEO21_05700 [Postia placenta]